MPVAPAGPLSQLRGPRGPRPPPPPPPPAPPPRLSSARRCVPIPAPTSAGAPATSQVTAVDEPGPALCRTPAAPSPSLLLAGPPPLGAAALNARRAAREHPLGRRRPGRGWDRRGAAALSLAFLRAPCVPARTRCVPGRTWCARAVHTCQAAAGCAVIAAAGVGLGRGRAVKAEARAAACAAHRAQPLLTRSVPVTSWPVLGGSGGPDEQGDLKGQILWPRDRYLCALSSFRLLNLSQLP